MPTLSVTLTRPPDLSAQQADALAAALAEELTRLTAEHLGKRPDLTAVQVAWVAPQHWFVGGRSLAASGQPGAQVDIAVTGDTNTAAQKAAWIEAVHALLCQHLPGLPETSYATVRDLPASAWGYGGLTQEARRQAP
jgi:4-oxalocrotonate tautomerase